MRRVRVTVVYEMLDTYIALSNDLFILVELSPVRHVLHCLVEEEVGDAHLDTMVKVIALGMISCSLSKTRYAVMHHRLEL